MGQIGKRASELELRHRTAYNALEQVARGLEPILRDTNQHHTADRLAAALGEIDACQAEITDFFDKNREAITLELLLGLSPYR
jgi:ABC-type transporter Mla subunit MlaD